MYKKRERVKWKENERTFFMKNIILVCRKNTYKTKHNIISIINIVVSKIIISLIKYNLYAIGYKIN